ncbi:MAG: hypothetical protein P4M09_22520 [Devosia sp.]|nr:hypothetical protein [Devosia sp.]
MSYVVAIAFKTVNCRFSPGDTVVAADIAGPMSFDDWVQGGFIVGSDVYYQVLATIAAGQSLSNAIPLNRREIVGIVMPAGWDAADLTFRSSLDAGATWSEVYQDSGVAVQLIVGAGRRIAQDPGGWKGIDALQIRSGTTTAPVTQSAARSITLIVRPAT